MWINKMGLIVFALQIAKMKVVKVALKPVKCPFCSVRFQTDKNVFRHVKSTHSDEKSKRLQCYFCKNLYTTKGNHDVHHRKTHAAEHLLYVTPEKVVIKGT